MMTSNSLRRVHWRYALWMCALVAWVIFLVWPVWDAYFAYDDFSWLAFVRDHTLGEVIHTPSPGGWTTPVSNIVFWLLFRAFGEHPKGYYVFCTLLHLINTTLTYVLTLLISRNIPIALLSTTLFATYFGHYIEFGPVTWVLGFVQILVAMPYLCSIVSFLLYLQSKNIGMYVLSIILICVAFITKETSLSLLPTLFLTSLFAQGEKRRLGNSLKLMMPFAIIAMGYLLWEIPFQLSGRYVQSGRYGLGSHLVTNWQYLANMVLPNIETGSLRTFFSSSALGMYYEELLALTYVIRVTLAIILLFVAWKGNDRARYWVGWIVLTYLPFTGFRGGWAGPYRYFYLPAVGFFALLGEGLYALWHRCLEHLPRDSKRRVIARCLAVCLVGVWGLIWLVPVRIWERQWLANSRLRSSVIQQVRSMQAEGRDIDLVYLVCFPDRFEDLKGAIPALTGIPASWETDSITSNQRFGSLVFRYRDGNTFSIEDTTDSIECSSKDTS